MKTSNCSDTRMLGFRVSGLTCDSKAMGISSLDTCIWEFPESFFGAIVKKKKKCIMYWDQRRRTPIYGNYYIYELHDQVLYDIMPMEALTADVR